MIGDPEPEPEPARRVIRFLDTLYSVDGKFDFLKIGRHLRQDTPLRELHRELVERSSLTMSYDDFKKEAIRIITKYNPRFQMKLPRTYFEKALIVDNKDKKQLTGQEHLRRWLHHRENLGGYNMDYVGPERKFMLNVNLAKSLDESSKRYVAVGHGHILNTTFMVPENVTIIFTGSMGFVKSKLRATSVLQMLKIPQSANALFTNPTWAREEGGDQWFLQNRRYIPPKSVINDQSLSFGKDFKHNGLFEVKDALPNDFNLYSRNDKYDILPVMFPNCTIACNMTLSEFVGTISRNGGGIVMTISCRSFKDTKIKIGEGLKIEKRNLVTRRSAVDSWGDYNIAAHHLMTDRPVLRNQTTGISEPVDLEYMMKLLAWYHLGKKTSKKFGGFAHTNLISRDGDGVFEFSRGKNGVVYKYVARVDGLPAPPTNGSRMMITLPQPKKRFEDPRPTPPLPSVSPMLSFRQRMASAVEAAQQRESQAGPSKRRRM